MNKNYKTKTAEMLYISNILIRVTELHLSRRTARSMLRNATSQESRQMVKDLLDHYDLKINLLSKAFEKRASIVIHDQGYFRP